MISYIKLKSFEDNDSPAEKSHLTNNVAQVTRTRRLTDMAELTTALQ